MHPFTPTLLHTISSNLSIFTLSILHFSLLSSTHQQISPPFFISAYPFIHKRVLLNPLTPFHAKTKTRTRHKFFISLLRLHIFTLLYLDRTQSNKTPTQHLTLLCQASNILVVAFLPTTHSPDQHTREHLKQQHFINFDKQTFPEYSYTHPHGDTE